jgi:hypothetical protein
MDGVVIRMDFVSQQNRFCFLSERSAVDDDGMIMQVLEDIISTLLGYLSDLQRYSHSPERDITLWSPPDQVMAPLERYFQVRDPVPANLKQKLCPLFG